MKKTNKYRLRMLRALIPYAYGVKRFFFLNGVLSLAALALSLIQPMFYKILVDDVIVGRKIRYLIYVICGYLGAFMLLTLIDYGKNYACLRVNNRVQFRVQLKIWRNFLEQRFEDFETMSVGDAKMRIDDDTGLTLLAYSNYQSIEYVTNIVKFVVLIFVVFFISWQLSLFSIVVIPPTFLLDRIISSRQKEINNARRETTKQESTWLHRSVQSWKEVKALNLQKYQKRLFIRFLHKKAIYNAKENVYSVARGNIIPIIKDELLMQFALYFFGGLLIITGRLSIGALLVFMQYFGMLIAATNSVSGIDAGLESDRPITDRILEGLEKPIEKRCGIQPAGEASIELKNVCFTYPSTEKEVLHDLSFRICAGERVGIVGKSGAGKSTVLKLITGMIKPCAGQVYFSGIDLTNLDIAYLHTRIGFVMQENMLFNTTIRENLFYACPQATQEQLDDACKKAYIYDFIQSLPDGYDSVIGERGVKLSGGQRQRIVLARLFLKDVDVFIFDEATSALDQHSESIVQDAIRNISKEKTIIVVAHRESSLALCDRKIVLGDDLYANK